MPDEYITPIDPELIQLGDWVVWYPYRLTAYKPHIARIIKPSPGDPGQYFDIEFGPCTCTADSSPLGPCDSAISGTARMRHDHITAIIPTPLGPHSLDT